LAEKCRYKKMMLALGRAILVEIRETVRTCRDSKDDQLLELAINGQGDCLITGDADLLTPSSRPAFGPSLRLLFNHRRCRLADTASIPPHPDSESSTVLGQSRK
jgi:hypothetical protein